MGSPPRLRFLVTLSVPLLSADAPPPRLHLMPFLSLPVTIPIPASVYKSTHCPAANGRFCLGSPHHSFLARRVFMGPRFEYLKTPRQGFYPQDHWDVP
ncbi:hypothetical protein M440DRAFT_1397005 [Trichoderma longibrachiatum ATCC 18648]|uniref:Secreted protein n=1 Tax=Trichoderma longibrachiatum ATCC 18648 TaxID=983965 RepID=A0A2T4CJU8_TRILO|nr:hypothetical protein M440DRAFT_1397005 [Trichoderma longibrachiatum ATCC 18648]